MSNEAVRAIRFLEDGIALENKSMILKAYSITEAEDFDWEDVPCIFDRWYYLVDQANDILLV